MLPRSTGSMRCWVWGKARNARIEVENEKLLTRGVFSQDETHTVVTTPACFVSLMDSMRYPLPAFTRSLHCSHVK